MNVIFADGTEVPQNLVVVPSTFTTTFELSVCGTSPITEEKLKNLIQTRHKVMRIKELKRLCVVRYGILP